MNSTTTHSTSRRPKFLAVFGGAVLFLVAQYAIALWRLSDTSGEMANKFSKLATDEYMGFLVMQNVQMLIAYVLLALTAALLLQPFVSLWTARSRHQSWRAIIVRSLLLTGLTHAFFTLRLVETRPYFLDVKDFGQWYYRLLEVIPAGAKPASLWAIFTLLPLGIAGFAAAWHLYHLRRRGRWLVAGTAVVLLGIYGILSISRAITQPTEKSLGQAKSQPKNVIIIGSDSLRGDLLGCAGYRPARSDGLAQGGVSPVIDSLAARSTRFEQCYTSIASTMESGVQLMSSQYPQSHGIRQMYPNKQTVAETVKRITPLPALLRQRGYDTAAIGDWCAGYYEVVPLGMEHLSVSSFDNFKIYMSQAVVMAHFVVPLYFDNPLGYQLFPQLLSFANFVTPDVVTQRVESRLASVATTQKPFFWHVFYSCNHLPYACPEPYNTLFADPDYVGKNRSKVEFDIESFISGTDLESKWKALPPPEMKQIRALYDGCTRKFDDCVGKILESLKANGLAENTIVVITSDHGDDHYEPGVTLGHGLTFNGGLQANRVPMIVHLPGAAPQVIPETVLLIDLIPSLADMIGQEKSTTWQGQSFANWIRKSEAPVFRPFYGETGFPFIQFSVPGVQRPKLPTMDELTYIDPNYNFQFVVKDEYLDRIIQAKQRCLKTRHWKLVCTPTAAGSRHFALYQMTLDPQAITDLATQRPEILAPLQAALVRWMDEKHESSIAEIFPSGEPQ